MAGVTGPMMRERPRDGLRFLLGLAAGGLVAALVVSIAAYTVGAVGQAVAPDQGRVVLLAVICGSLGAADLLDRTPHVWRQVPQALVRVLPPGRLGSVWGFDIGLLFTTQKVVSLMWAALAAAVLLEPETAPTLLIAMAMLSSVTIAAWSITGAVGAGTYGAARERRLMRAVRTTSGTVLLGTCASLLTQAF